MQNEGMRAQDEWGHKTTGAAFVLLLHQVSSPGTLETAKNMPVMLSPCYHGNNRPCLSFVCQPHSTSHKPP